MKEVIGLTIMVYLSYRFICFLLEAWTVTATAKQQRHAKRRKFFNQYISNNKN